MEHVALAPFGCVRQRAYNNDVCSRLRRQAEAPASLGQVLEGADAAKRRAVLRNMSIELIPVMEKGIVDPVLSHRFVHSS